MSEGFEGRELLRIKEVAALLNISRAKAYQIAKDGTLGSVMIDGSRRVPVDVFERFVADLKAQARASVLAEGVDGGKTL